MRWLRPGLRALIVAAMLAALSGGASAVEPDEILPDPKLEARARALSLDLRCLVCQNQSIDDSNAPLARDLRLLVRERLRAGDSDQDVIRFVVSRYGEFVLLRPPLNVRTLVLWLSGPLLLLLVGWLMWRAVPRAGADAARSAGAAPLTREEEERLQHLLARAGATDAAGPDSTSGQRS